MWKTFKKDKVIEIIPAIFSKNSVIRVYEKS